MTKGEWWHHEPVVRRFVSDLIAGEVARLRPTSLAMPASPFDRPLSLTDDLGIDSLELVSIAGTLNEILHLHVSGVEDQLLARRRLGDWTAIATEGLSAYSASMTFRTSGSTGLPTRCEHRVADLYDEVTELSALFRGRSRVLSAVRSHHIYGFLFTVALPHVLALSPSAVIDARNTLPSSWPARLRAGDLVIGYPEFWRAMVQSPARIPAGVMGVTSTAPCPDDVARDVMQLGLTQLVQVYGSTETAGVGVRTSADNPFGLLSTWRRSDERDGDLVRMSSDGRISTRSVPDVLTWEDDRHFRPLRRIDDVVQVGGENVSLSAVRAALLEHPLVRDASVRVMPAELGGRLKAFVVAEDAVTDLASLHLSLDAWCATRLPGVHRPRAVTFGNTLPVNALGKPTDWPVSATIQA